MCRHSEKKSQGMCSYARVFWYCVIPCSIANVDLFLRGTPLDVWRWIEEVVTRTKVSCMNNRGIKSSCMKIMKFPCMKMILPCLKMKTFLAGTMFLLMKSHGKFGKYTILWKEFSSIQDFWQSFHFHACKFHFHTWKFHATIFSCTKIFERVSKHIENKLRILIFPSA